jgi:Flavin-binding monooxygenase-like
VIPDWPGVFAGDLLHSSAYRNPAGYQGKRVLVAGSGSSGMEIAHDLATGGAEKVWLAVRTPPNIMLRSLPNGLSADWISLPLYHAPVRLADGIGRVARRANLGDLSEFGLPIPDEGVFARARRLGQAPTLIDMDVIDASRADQSKWCPPSSRSMATRSCWRTVVGWTPTPRRCDGLPPRSDADGRPPRCARRRRSSAGRG